jgi:hypothetical protein
MSKPINRTNIFNTDLPAADANFLAADIKPTFEPGKLKIYVCIAVNGNFYVHRTSGAASVDEYLGALTANNAQLFEVPWVGGESINFRHSADTAKILKLQVDEIWNE